MIRFFRRIRQQLIKENKASKYILYAIGEIALVMIGILLALQVNNWNQEQKNSERRQLYYKKMEQTFKSDLQKLREYRVRIDQKKSNIEQFYSGVATSASFKEASDYADKIDFIILKLTLDMTLEKILLNTGDIALLPNEFQEQLISYWNEYNNFIAATKNNYDLYYNNKSLASVMQDVPSVQFKTLIKDNSTLVNALNTSRNYRQEILKLDAGLVYLKYNYDLTLNWLETLEKMLEDLLEISSGNIKND